MLQKIRALWYVRLVCYYMVNSCKGICDMRYVDIVLFKVSRKR
jgi:hypothetical protein